MTRTTFAAASVAGLLLLCAGCSSKDKGVPDVTGSAGEAGASGAAGTAGMAGGAAGSLGTAGTFPGFVDLTTCEWAGADSGYYCFGITGRTPDDTANLPSTGCAGFPTAADRVACEQLVTCLRGMTCQGQIMTALATRPTDYLYATDPLPCLCGTAVSKDTCLTSSSWDGVCQAEFVAAAGGAGVVLTRYADTRYPVGVAKNLMTCDVQVPCIPPGGN